MTHCLQFVLYRNASLSIFAFNDIHNCKVRQFQFEVTLASGLYRFLACPVESNHRQVGSASRRTCQLVFNNSFTQFIAWLELSFSVFYLLFSFCSISRPGRQLDSLTSAAIMKACPIYVQSEPAHKSNLCKNLLGTTFDFDWLWLAGPPEALLAGWGRTWPILPFELHLGDLGACDHIAEQIHAVAFAAHGHTLWYGIWHCGWWLFTLFCIIYS